MNLTPAQNGPAYLAVVIAAFGVINTLVEIPEETQTAISVLILAIAGVFGVVVQRTTTLPRPPAGSENEIIYTDAEGHVQPLVDKAGRVL
jgi:hypothetical protein